MPNFLQSKAAAAQLTGASKDDVELTSKYLNIAFHASEDLENTAMPAISAQLVEKLSMVLKHLGNPTKGSSTSMATTSAPTSTPSTHLGPVTTLQASGSDSNAALLQYIPLLLRMTCLQRAALPSASNAATSQPPKQMQQEQIKILALLTSIALHPTLSSGTSPSQAGDHSNGDANTLTRPHDISAFCLDVAATLCDESILSEEARALCGHFLRDKVKDARVGYLFGTVNTMGSLMTKDVGAGLQMVKEGKGVVGEWKVRQWEVLEASGSAGDACLGLGLFGGRRG